MQRIRMLTAGAATAALTLATAGGAIAARPTVNGPMAFEPIDGSAYDLTADWDDDPFLVPDGYHQVKVSDETDLDIYDGQDDLTDMNTVNETGPQAGRYLYRTHEVDEGGALSVVDLRTGEATVLVRTGDFPEFTSGRDLDGLRWTPWGTLLFAEEDPQGHIYEIVLDPEDPTTAVDVRDLPQVGRMRHEGIEVGSDGAVYVIDELNGGSIFRFVPDTYGDLSSGQLHALKVDGIDDADQDFASGSDLATRTGSFTWVPVDMDQAAIDAKPAADAVGATEYGRPEDLERIGRMLYVALTTEDAVVAIDLAADTIVPFVVAGSNAPEQDLSATGPVDAPPTDEFVTGFDDPDNLAEGPDGRLWIVEDNSPSDIWVTDRDLGGDGLADGVHLFASLRDGSWDCDEVDDTGDCADWDDDGAEGTGIYFGTDPHTLYVNIQHAEKALADGTWAITRR